MNKFLIAAAVAVLVPGTAFASPYYASIGSPNSLQHTAVTTALNLNDLDYDDDPDTPGFDMEGDADTIGGAFTYWGSAGVEGERYELRYQKAFRPFEGSRARVLVDPILNVLHVNKGDTAVLGTLSAGVELPVQPNWLITPRVAFGASNNDGSFGASSEVLTLSATSRYKIAQVGRGDLTIGNMVGWSTTTDTGIGKKPFFYFQEDVWSFRNGIAYQLPFKGRMFGGRQGSLRASYTWTKLAGDPQAYENVHEAALSLGIRTREAEQKSRAEQLRIGLIYTHGVSSFSHDFDFDAVTLTVGYRF